MTAIQFKFRPEDVKISSEEILADLNYPAPVARRREDDRRAPRRRART
jgi:hypothetical protein